MKIARVSHENVVKWVEVDGDHLYTVEREGKSWQRIDALGRLENSKLLAPIEQHNKVIGLLDNFSGRKDRKGPGLFIKPMSAVIGHQDDIHWPEGMEALNFEAELGVVIGLRAKRVTAETALDHVLGYTVTNDLTSFPTLMDDGPTSLSTRFKLYDDFLPIGPWIATDVDGDNLRLTSEINGVPAQDVSTAEMAFSVADTVAWVSSVMTLEPGDIISMGTPPGFVDMQPGDVIRCSIEGIGVLENRLV